MNVAFYANNFLQYLDNCNNLLIIPRMSLKTFVWNLVLIRDVKQMVVLNKSSCSLPDKLLPCPLYQHMLDLSVMWAGWLLSITRAISSPLSWVSARVRLWQVSSSVIPPNSSHLAESKCPSHEHFQSLLGTTCQYAGNGYFTPRMSDKWQGL